jgi:hypothetical protein
MRVISGGSCGHFQIGARLPSKISATARIRSTTSQAEEMHRRHTNR